MTRSSVQFTFLTLLVILLLSGCTDRKTTQKPKNTLALPQRIVSLTPSNTEILFALGLGDKVVGVTSRCDYPPEARNKPKIGDMNASIERVVAVKPDLVVADSVLNDSAITRLRSLKTRVLATDAHTFDDVISNIRLVGRETGAEKRAEEIVGSMESAIEAAKGTATNHPRVLVVAQASPLWTTGPKTFVDDMIHYLGAENIGADTQPGKFNQMSTETAVARNPDVIIVTLSSDKSFFEKSSIWKGANAVRKHRVYVIVPDLIFRGGPRLAKGLAEMARILRRDSSVISSCRVARRSSAGENSSGRAIHRSTPVRPGNLSPDAVPRESFPSLNDRTMTITGLADRIRGTGSGDRFLRPTTLTTNRTHAIMQPSKRLTIQLSRYIMSWESEE